MPTVYDDDVKICSNCGTWNHLDYIKCRKCKHEFVLPLTRIVCTEWGSVERKVKPINPDDDKKVS